MNVSVSKSTIFSFFRSNFAVEGDKMTVQPSVEKVIKEFHSAKKPIGLELKIHLLYLTELTLINSNPSQRRIKNTSFY